VNQGAISIYVFFSFVLGNIENEIDGPSHAHAKSRCLGKFNTHIVQDLYFTDTTVRKRL
jgi:hypothetical protein